MTVQLPMHPAFITVRFKNRRHTPGIVSVSRNEWCSDVVSPIKICVKYIDTFFHLFPGNLCSLDYGVWYDEDRPLGAYGMSCT